MNYEEIKISNYTTNDFYAKEDRRSEPKDYFKLINRELQKENWASLTDVGCATGDFLDYMIRQNGDKSKWVGVDNYPRLMDIAKKRISKCDFYEADVYTGKNLDLIPKSDVVCMSGVLYLFNEFEGAFDNLFSLVNEGGMAYVFSTFNTCDSRVDHIWSHGAKHGHYMEFSMQEISRYLDEKGLRHEYVPFQISTEIPVNDDPIRTYTIRLADGTLGVKNGINVWHNFYLLKIYL